MAKVGRKPKSPDLKIIQGTDQPCRENVLAFQVSEGEACLPAQFEKLRESKPVFAAIVLDIWNDQVAKYRQRGQATAGFSRALYQMCLLEAEIHEKSWQGAHIDMAMRNGLRAYYSEFHDTPAGNIVPAGRPGGNPFAKNGKPRKP